MAGTYRRSSSSSASSVAPASLAPFVAKSLCQAGLADGNSGLSANDATFTEFVLEREQTIDQVLFRVASASGNVDAGIYDNDGASGGPGTRLVSSGSTACPAAGSRAVAVAATTLQPGRYWAALAMDNAVATFYYRTVTVELANGTIRYTKGSSFPLPASIAAPTADGSGNTFYILAAKA